MLAGLEVVERARLRLLKRDLTRWKDEWKDEVGG